MIIHEEVEKVVNLRDEVQERLSELMVDDDIDLADDQMDSDDDN
jgi:hypothetical protein|tara:strand:- start:846 stop:977 length:132 start_codon:yes stop_codon:yes gene_type:complete